MQRLATFALAGAILVALLPIAARADEADPTPEVQFAQAPKLAIVVCETFDPKHRALLRVEHWLRGKGGAQLLLPRPFLEERQPRIDQRKVLESGGRYLLCLDADDQPRYRNSAIPLPYVGALREAEWATLSSVPKKLAAFLKEVLADAQTWGSKPVSGLQMRRRPGVLVGGGPLTLTLELRNLRPDPIPLPKAILELTGYLPKTNRYVKLSEAQAQAKGPARVELAPQVVEPGKPLVMKLGEAVLGPDLRTPSSGPVTLFCTLHGSPKGATRNRARTVRAKKPPPTAWAGSLSISFEFTPKAK